MLLGYGVDTLIFWLSWDEAYSLPGPFQAALDTALLAYRDGADSNLVGIHDHLWLFNPAGNSQQSAYEVAEVQSGRKFRWRLMFQGGMISVSLAAPRASTRRAGQVHAYVEVSGRYMAACGRDADAVISMCSDSLARLVGADPSRVQISRIDLFADVLSPEPLRLDHVHLFVSRSKARTVYGLPGDGQPEGAASAPGGPLLGNTGAAMHEVLAYEEHTVEIHLRGPHWSGFRFGAGDLLARVYSKTVQAITDYSARLLLDSYGNPEGHVIRVEYQLRAGALASMELDGVRDFRSWPLLLRHMSSLWAYLSRSWLTLREDSHTEVVRNRPLHPLWQAVISAFDPSAPLVTRSFRGPVASVSSLLTQAVGCIITAAGALGLHHHSPAPALLRSWLKRATWLLGLTTRDVPAVGRDQFAARYRRAWYRYAGLSLT